MRLPFSTERSRSHKRTNSSLARRARARARLKFGATLDSLEPRQLLTVGAFLQGTAYDANQLPLPGATIELFAVTGNTPTQIGHATTDSNGNYYFDDSHNLDPGQSIIAPGTYQLVEVAPTGFQLSGAQVNTVAPPDKATILPSNAIQVTIADPSQLSYTLNNWSDPAPEVIATFQAQFSDSLIANQFDITVSEANPPQTSSNLISYCVDLNGPIAFSTPFAVTPEPAQTALANGGQIAYLYNHYGLGDPLSLAPAALQQQLPFQNPSTNPGLDADVTGALQIAIWELEYGSDFQLLGFNSAHANAQDFADIQSAAAWFENDSSTHSEQAMVLAVQSTGQSVLAPLNLDFTNTAVTKTQSNPTINTTPSATTVTLGTTPPTLKDTADLEFGDSPTGSITFTLYQGATLVDTETVPVNGNGLYTTPTGYTPPTSAAVTGTYQWDASYSGDANNTPVSENNAASEQVTVSPSTPAINTVAGGTVIVGSGTKLTDTAALTGGFSPTGSITFTLTRNGTTVDTETVPVNGDKSYTTPSGFLPTTTGTYLWSATYSGDSNNIGVNDNGVNESETVSPSTPAINTVAGGTVIVGSGTKLTDTAILSGGYSPTGSITFTLTRNGTTVDTETVPVNGDKSYTTPSGFLPTTTGTYLWSATYSGDSNNIGVNDNGVNESETVSPSTPAINTVAGGTVIVGSGTKLTDTAILSGGYSPTGSITFTLTRNGTTVDTETVPVNGDKSYTTPSGFLPTTTGTYLWSATYSGDSNNIGVNDNGVNESETVSPSTPAINTVAGGTVIVGSGTKLTDTAILSGGYSPTGSITFTLHQGTTLVDTETVPVTGDKSYTTPSGFLPTTTGTYLWSATYSGDSNNIGVNDNGVNESETVSPSTPNIVTTPGGTVTMGGISINGTKFLDLTGNGFSADDTPQSGVTINLYQATSGGATFVRSTATLADGSYSFAVTSPGTYYVQESVPTGYLQTGGGPSGSAGNTFYTIVASGGHSYSGDNFDDFLIPTCAPTNVSYKVTTPSNHSTTVAALDGNTDQGDTVTVTFTVPSGMNDQLTLVSYIAPGPSFSDATANQQAIYQVATGIFAPGTHSLTVKIPNTYYQIDFVCGQAIDQLEPDQNGNAYGPDSANILYHAEGRFIDSDSGGTTAPSPSSLNSGLPLIPTPTSAPNPTATLTDSATLSGGNNPTGTITFYLFAPGVTPNGSNSNNVYSDTVTVTGNGGYNTGAGNHPGGYVPTVAGTYQWVAVYGGDANNGTAISPFGSEPETVSPSTPNIVTTPGGTVTMGGISINGTKFLDLTGNGFSADDTPQSGVTINLYQATSGGATFVRSTATLADGSYSFAVTSPGTYYVQESVPTGYLQTGGGPSGSAGNTFYTIVASGGHSYSGDNFDDFLIPTCAPTNVSYKVTTPSNHSTTVAALDGNTDQGDTVTVTFTVPSGMNDQLTLVSYIAPGPSFSDATANQQAIYQVATGIFAPGTHSLTVKIPNTYYQIDFVCGQAIDQLEPDQNGNAYGPDSANILYHAEGRFIDSDSGGTTAPSPSSLNSGLPLIPTPTSAPNPTATLTDSATLSGGNNPTGTITFYLFAPGVTPNGSNSNNVYSDTVTVTGNGGYNTGAGNHPGGYVPTVAGTYQWVAVYGGDANNGTAISPFGSEPETVSPPTPAITTVAGPTVVLGCGAKLTDTATLSGGINPTGTITFNLYYNGGTTPVDTETVTVTGDKSYTTPTGYTPTAAGTYLWSATYSGDANNGSVHDNGQNETETVTKGTPVSSGDFATIGFWHNKNGQAVINSFNGGPTQTQLGSWLANNFPHLFGASNPYTGTSLAGLTNAQVASVYLNLWTPSGVTKNTYVQAFAVALGIYADSSSLGYNSTAAGFGFVKAPVGGSSLTFGIGSNGPAFPGLGSTSTVLQILQVVDANFNPTTGNFYGGDQTKTSDANNVLNGINTTGDITLVTTGSTIVTGTSQLVGAGFYVHQGTLLVYVDNSLGNITPDEQARIDDAIANYNIQLGQYGATLVEVSSDQANDADITIQMADTTDIGGVAEGVLGVTEMGGEIILVNGWNWYLGSDPSQIGPDQYDFETVAAHELGHAIGLGHSPDAASVMYPVLATDQVRRTLSAGDLDVLDQDGGGAPEPLMAAVPASVSHPTETASAPRSDSSSIRVAPPALSSATGLPGGGTPTTIVANNALTATPSIAAPPTATMTPFGLATVRVSSAAGMVEAPGTGAASGLAGVLSQAQAGATITTVSTGIQAQPIAGSAAQAKMSSPTAFAFARPDGFATTAQDDADNALQAMAASSLVPDKVLDELASDSALWPRSGGDGSITVPVLAPESVPGIAVSTDPDESQDPSRSPASFAGRLAVVGLAVGLWGGTAVRNARKRRSWGLGLASKPLPPRKG